MISLRPIWTSHPAQQTDLLIQGLLIFSLFESLKYQRTKSVCVRSWSILNVRNCMQWTVKLTLIDTLSSMHTCRGSIGCIVVQTRFFQWKYCCFALQHTWSRCWAQRLALLSHTQSIIMSTKLHSHWHWSDHLQASRHLRHWADVHSRYVVPQQDVSQYKKDEMCSAMPRHRQCIGGHTNN